MNKKNFSQLLSGPLAAIVLLVVTVCGVGSAVLSGYGQLAMSVYWPLAFWLLAGTDFYRSQVKENGESEVSRRGFSFADRFIGYIFVAPIVFPLVFPRLLGRALSAGK